MGMKAKFFFIKRNKREVKKERKREDNKKGEKRKKIATLNMLCSA